MIVVKANKVNYKKLLKNINLEISKGEFISLVGSNGSGKTTLALLMAGLIDDNIEGLEIKSKVGLIFENPDNQIIGSTVDEDIAFGLQNLKKTREQINEKIDEVLIKLDMVELKKRDVTSLSGGQKQKLAIASLLALDYEFYILDEVTSMLDPESKKMVIELIKDLVSQGKTIIQITHFIDELEYTPRTIVLKDAKVVYDGTTLELLKDKKMLKDNRLI